jgi:hypothetical protein
MSTSNLCCRYTEFVQLATIWRGTTARIEARSGVAGLEMVPNEQVNSAFSEGAAVPDSPCGCSMPVSKERHTSRTRTRTVDNSSGRANEGRHPRRGLKAVIAPSKTRRLVAASRDHLYYYLWWFITGVPRLEGLLSAPPSEKSLAAFSCMPADASSSFLS